MANQQQDSLDSKVTDLLSKMSVEEKAGQMTQIDIRNLLNNGYGNTDEQLDTAKLREAILKYHVGSLLNCIKAYTPEKWQQLITQIQAEAQKSRLKIPIIYGTDAVHGVGFMKGATLFPHNIGMAASRNNQLVAQASHITAVEARAVGLTWNFAPVFDVGRQPYWSRFEETYGEDVTIVSQMGAAAVRAMEGNDLRNKNTVAACMKHFLGYSAPKNGIDRTPAHIPEIILREYYLPPFQMAVDSGVTTAMINSAEINGIPTHANKTLLTDVLRNELKFEGLVCSDWEDIIRLHTWQKVASSPKQAVEMAVNAGVDMSMVPNDYSFFHYVVELVNEGKISKERLDEAVGRILKLKLKLGLFENSFPAIGEIANIGKPEYAEVSLKAASESITLLKNNNNILPLQTKQRVLLAGPCANSIMTLNSAWSYVWQGDVDSLYPSNALTIQGALENALGKNNIISNAGREFNDPKNYNTALFKNKGAYDVILLCLGEKPYAEQPGVIKDLNLPEEQKQLVRDARATGKPVILCLVEGRPRLLPDIEPLTDAVLLCYRPGNMGGKAIADIITGVENPSGLLPFTYPKYNGDIQTYDHKYKETEQQLVAGVSDTLAFSPQWEFGHGLSYTTFEITGLKVSKNIFNSNDTLVVELMVENTGTRKGKIGVDLFSRDHFASITPSVKRLRKYTKVELQPQEKKQIKFLLSNQDLSFINDRNLRITEPGLFDLIVGKNKVTIEFKP